MATDTVVALWDYNIEAEVNSDTNDLIIYENADAVKNALTCWCRTNRGEILNSPESGGGLDEYTFKQFDESRKTELLFKFRSQLDAYFSPRLKVIELLAEMDATFKTLKIKLKYFIPLFNTTKLSYFPLKRLQYRSIFETQQEEINYTGNTLENFIRIYLWDQRGIGLKYNGTYYQWGKFIFTGLSESDDNFEVVQDLINSNRDR